MITSAPREMFGTETVLTKLFGEVPSSQSTTYAIYSPRSVLQTFEDTTYSVPSFVQTSQLYTGGGQFYIVFQVKKRKLEAKECLDNI